MDAKPGVPGVPTAATVDVDVKDLRFGGHG
jgi:hypothetical protein